MSLHTHRVTQGDTLTPLAVQLKQKDSTGTLAVVDLTGKTVKFRMVTDAGVSHLAETTTGVTVTAASTGKVQYDFSAAAVATAGIYWGWFTVYSGSEVDTFPSDGRALCIDVTPSEP